MDDFRFILVAWLMVIILSEDKKPKTFIQNLGITLYFIAFVLMFLASFLIPVVRELFIWFALYPLVLKVIRFAVNKIADSINSLLKRELKVDDDADV